MACLRLILTFLNRLLPKYRKLVVYGIPNVESSAVELANFVIDKYDLPVYFVISDKFSDHPALVLNKNINLLKRGSLSYFYHYLTCKFLIFTHGTILNTFSKRQVVVNVWHGVFYKKIGKLNGEVEIPASITVGTSLLTQDMFSKAFGVAPADVLICGYPRNDAMLKAAARKAKLRTNLGANISACDKLVIWLPTYRTSTIGITDGKEVGNPFYIEKFDVVRFNAILRRYNAVCMVKPHPMAPVYDHAADLDHLIFIDDKWIADHSLTTYQLIGCTDILVSDVSSVMVDYVLLDQPIVCVSTDFDEYRASRGFYFEDIEEWIPAPILKAESEFMNAFELLLSQDIDPSECRRKRLKTEFFRYPDDRSTERLITHIFGI